MQLEKWRAYEIDKDSVLIENRRALYIAITSAIQFGNDYVHNLTYNLAIRGIHFLLFIEQWVPSPPFWAQTHPKRFIMVYS